MMIVSASCVQSLLFVVAFVFVGRAVAERRVQPLAVEEDLDVVEHRCPCLLAGAERAAAEQVLLKRGVEVLADGVVVAVASGAHLPELVGRTWGAQTLSSLQHADSASTADITAVRTDHAEKLRG